MFKIGDKVRTKYSTEIGTVRDTEDRGGEQWCHVTWDGPLSIWYSSDYLVSANGLLNSSDEDLYYPYTGYEPPAANTQTEPKCTCRTLIFGHEDGCTYSEWVKLEKQLSSKGN